MDSDSLYVRTREIMATELGSAETVMLDPERGAYFGVRNSARLLWDRLAEPATLPDLADVLISHYSGLDRERAVRDARVFLDQLIGAGLVSDCSLGA